MNSAISYINSVGKLWVPGLFASAPSHRLTFDFLAEESTCLCPRRVMNVVTARTKMTTENIKNATQDASVGAQGAHVAPEKAPAKKTASRKKGPRPRARKRPTAAKLRPPPQPRLRKPPLPSPLPRPRKPPNPRKAPGCARAARPPRWSPCSSARTAPPAEIMEKMGWQKHTVRGFMAGAIEEGWLHRRVFQVRQGRPYLPHQPLTASASLPSLARPAFQSRRAFLIGHSMPAPEQDLTASDQLPPRIVSVLKR